MDENTAELIALLGTRIGMIMEDVSETALTLGRMEQAEMAAAIDTLDHASTAISAMIAALRNIVI